MQPDTALAWLEQARDACPPTRHVGVLVPWANTVVETELPLYLHPAAVAHFARLVPAGRTTALDEDFLTGLRHAVPGAVEQLARIPLERTIMACTSAAFTADEPAPTASSFDALVEVLRSHGIDRIRLATPYPEHVGRSEVARFERDGIAVVQAVHLGSLDDYDTITGEQTVQLTATLDTGPDAECLVLSCTNWHTATLIEPLTRRLGVPVMSSNLATAILALTPERS